MRAEPAGNRIRIILKDKGPGFPEELLRHGPEAARYISRAGTDGENGTGYGLRIAALCAERLDAVIEARNPSEGGAEFSILLPSAAPSSRVSEHEAMRAGGDL